MGNTKNIIQMKKGYLDFNGNLVTHTIEHNTKPGNEEDILKELFKILNQKIENTNQIKIIHQEFDDCSITEIKESYQNEGVECEILDQEEEDSPLAAGEGSIINYTISLPLWYIIYRFFATYAKENKETVASFKVMTTQELKETLLTHKNQKKNTGDICGGAH